MKRIIEPAVLTSLAALMLWNPPAGLASMLLVCVISVLTDRQGDCSE